MSKDLFEPLGLLGDPRHMGTSCGVYWCTMDVNDHEPQFDPESGDFNWDYTYHNNEHDKVWWIAPMPEEWR